MSCFWDGLRTKVHALRHFRSSEVRGALQSANVPTRCVLYNGRAFTEQQLRENFAWVSTDDRPWNAGHDTPAADPFLALVCELFCCNISFDVRGTVHTFVHPKATTTVRFQATSGHFS